VTPAERFKALTERSGIYPYRNGGKIRVAYDKRLPKTTLEKVVYVIKVISKSHPELFQEVTMEKKEEWKRKNLTADEVCDDPMPVDMDVNSCHPEEILEYAKRWHFDLELVEGKLKLCPHDGFREDEIRKWIPSWHKEAVKNRTADIINHLKGKNSNG